MVIYSGEENKSPDEYIKKIIVEDLKLPSQPGNKPVNEVKAFGLNTEFKGEWRFGYYIGVDYLDEKNEIPLLVTTKIPDLDYWTMFTECLKNKDTAQYMSRIYDIRINKPSIELSKDDARPITLIIMYHYLSLLSELVKKPLVKSYVNKTENLKAKIKGKILLGGHIKKNISNKRYDRIMCSYDEYSTDCPANRLLHSAYKICLQYFAGNNNITALFSKYNYIDTYFSNIGYIESLMEVSKIKTNPLFLEYKDTLRIAKIIFKLKSYDEKSQDENKMKIPPYIIDMPKLFEIYVLALLKSANPNIGYQVRGNYGEVDFLDYDNKIIIDTKYKKIYDSEEEYKIEDIRQVAGYARDIGLLRKLFGTIDDTVKNKVPDCLIIYPDMANGFDVRKDDKAKLFEGLLSESIEQFNKFYKFGIKLPEKGNNNGKVF
jgi:hypothetical protein